MTNKKVGVLLREYGAGQLGYLLARNIHAYQDEVGDIDIIVYYENLHRNPVTPRFAIMQIAEAWCQDGVMIATNITTASKLINFPGTNKKYFYVWDLEWTRGQYRDYDFFKSIYTNKRLKLIARCEHHKKAIENAFDVKVDSIVDDVNIKEMIERIKQNE